MEKAIDLRGWDVWREICGVDYFFCPGKPAGGPWKPGNPPVGCGKGEPAGGMGADWGGPWKPGNPPVGCGKPGAAGRGEGIEPVDGPCIPGNPPVGCGKGAPAGGIGAAWGGP